MAFSFGNTGGFGAQQQNAPSGSAQLGEELHEVQTEALGFQPVSGDARLRLLPSPWPTEKLPPPTANLFSVASAKGLVAAAGPDTLVIASTESVRKGFSAEKIAGSNIRPFEPQLKIPIPRISQLVFSADESTLVISGEDSGGLIAYQVDGLSQGNTNPAVQISTNNIALRALAPNPTVEKAELFAVVNTNGELSMADLKSGQLVSGANGAVLRTGISCVSWSNKGKQLVAGLADGTGCQMSPEGVEKAVIPRAPGLQDIHHVSSISWLENDVFLIVYTENSNNDTVPASEYFIVTHSSGNYTFQKLPEVCQPAFTSDRPPPPFQFMARLRTFPPHIKDIIAVASTSSSDIGLFSRSDAPLSAGVPAEQITGKFTTTTMAEDSRRAELPMTDAMDETSALGLAFDLSSKDNIPSPIPADPEIFESSNPVPNLMVLNSDGVLASWWIVYTPSIRERTVYPGLVVAGGPLPQQTPQQQFQLQRTPPSAPQAPAFGQRSASNHFGAAQKSGFGAPSPLGSGMTVASTAPPSSGFGAPSALGAGSAFGAPSALGTGKPSWTSSGFGSTAPAQTSSSAFGQPAFGSATPIAGPKLGATGGFGGNTGAFGQPSSLTSPAFGQSANLGMRGGGFGTAPPASTSAPGAGPASNASPFGAYANSGGFGTPKPAAGNPFSKLGGGDSTEGLFGKPAEASSFGSTMNTGSVFGTQSKPDTQSLLGGGGFKLGSTFKADGSAADDERGQLSSRGAFSLGSGLGNLLGDQGGKKVSPTHDKEEQMAEGTDSAAAAPQPATPTVTTPSTTLQHQSTAPPPLSGLFGTQSQSDTTPASVQDSKPAGWTFGSGASTTSKAPNSGPTAPLSGIFGIKSQSETTPAAVQSGKPRASIFGAGSAKASAETAAKPTAPPIFSGTFGTQAQTETTPAAVQSSKPAWSFADASSTTPNDTPSKPLPSQRSQEPDETPKIKTEPLSDGETTPLSSIPEAPLPPHSTSKSSYAAGDTSTSSSNDSKGAFDDAPLPPDFTAKAPAAANEEDKTALPEGDESDLSSFEGSGEEVSPAEEHAGESTEEVKFSPESSFGKNDDQSPTGGLFTKVSHLPTQQRHVKSLFGEVGNGPVFAPPIPQQSPRSPSPVRSFLENAQLKPQAIRAVSAPSRPKSAIDARKAQLAKSPLAPLEPSTEELWQKERERVAAQNAASIRQQSAGLEDDEDERVRAELNRSPLPTTTLERFLPHQEYEGGIEKPTIPAQIERLYRDINSMINTLGINARSLSAFMLHQSRAIGRDEADGLWTDMLESDEPEALFDENRPLADIDHLFQGTQRIANLLEKAEPGGAQTILQVCQNLLSRDLPQLRTRLGGIQKTFDTRKNTEAIQAAPLSAEQASIQRDLRKASTDVQVRLAEAEQGVALLRAKFAEKTTTGPVNGRTRSSSTKKPTVEAVRATIEKMTSMAEKKSTNIDVLEAQLRKLGFDGSSSVNGSRQGSTEPDFQTPQRSSRGKSLHGLTPKTPGSGKSVYLTPDSKSRTVNGTPGRGNILKGSGDGPLVSVEEAERWRRRAHHRKEVGVLLKDALAAKKIKVRGLHD